MDGPWNESWLCSPDVVLLHLKTEANVVVPEMSKPHCYRLNASLIKADEYLGNTSGRPDSRIWGDDGNTMTVITKITFLSAGMPPQPGSDSERTHRHFYAKLFVFSQGMLLFWQQKNGNIYNTDLRELTVSLICVFFSFFFKGRMAASSDTGLTETQREANRRADGGGWAANQTRG